MDTNNTQRPDFMSNLPESISDPRLYSMHSDNTAATTFNVDEDDETEELAIGMADHPIDTPRMGTFSQNRQIQPDSPTPEHRTLPANGVTLQATPQKISSANKLATPSHDFGGATGVRRRSSAGKRNKALGDTDSEGEIEPGTVTIIR